MIRIALGGPQRLSGVGASAYMHAIFRLEF